MILSDPETPHIDLLAATLIRGFGTPENLAESTERFFAIAREELGVEPPT
jgi:hypothetical protein